MDIETANESLLKKMVSIVNRPNKYLFNTRPKYISNPPEVQISDDE
jgi:hypothetical protein